METPTGNSEVVKKAEEITSEGVWAEARGHFSKQLLDIDQEDRQFVTDVVVQEDREQRLVAGVALTKLAIDLRVSELANLAVLRGQDKFTDIQLTAIAAGAMKSPSEAN